LDDAAEVVVVAGVVEREGKLLMGCRPSGAHLAGCWEFPGGKLRPGESHGDCLRREMTEEIGLAVEPGPLLFTAEHAHPGGRLRLHLYACAAATGALEARWHTALQWVAPAELARLETPREDRAMLAMLAARYGATAARAGRPPSSA